MKRLLLISLMILVPFSSQSQVNTSPEDAGPSLMVSPLSLNRTTRCSDWSLSFEKRVAFEKRVDEFIHRAVTGGDDQGCINALVWTLTDDLFAPDQQDQYEDRLTEMNAKYLASKHSGLEAEADSIEDLFVAFQHRWLSEQYMSLFSYKSKTYAYATAGGLAAAGLAVGGAIVFRSPILQRFNSSSRSVFLRMLRYLSTYASEKWLTSAGLQIAPALSAGVWHDWRAHKAAGPRAAQAPPMDYLHNGSGIFMNYSELDASRDMLGLASSALSYLAADLSVRHAAIAAYSAIGRLGGVVSKIARPNLLGAVLGFVVSSYVSDWTKRSITRYYHELFQQDVEKAISTLTTVRMNDWETTAAQAELTALLLQWSSTQEQPLQAALEKALMTYKQMQVCTRLNTRFEDEAEKSPWSRRVVGQSELKGQVERGEEQLRRNVAKIIENRKIVLQTIRAHILRATEVTKSLNKPYLRAYEVQQQILLDRIETRLSVDRTINDEVKLAQETRLALDPSAPAWDNTDLLRELNSSLNCIRFR